MKTILKTSRLELAALLGILTFCLGSIFFGVAYADEKTKEELSNYFVPSEFEAYFANNEFETRSILKFYSERSFDPFWYGEARRIAQFQQAVNKSFHHGLPQEKYEFWQKTKNKTAYEFEIFNRWGDKVFKTIDVNVKWNGEGDQDGIYNWVVNIVDELGKLRVESGEVTLFR